jgi:Tfp pilus assembly protein PilF
VNWRAALAKPEAGFVMRSSETAARSGTISFGEIQRRQAVPPAAWKQYRKALSEDDLGHHAESFRLALSAATLSPAFAQAHSALAVWYLRNLDLTNAEREIRTASALDPYYLPARELRGVVFLIRGELVDARKTLDAVVVRDSTRGVAQYFLAATLYELGEPALANNHLECSVRLRRHQGKALVADLSSFDTPE